MQTVLEGEHLMTVGMWKQSMVVQSSNIVNSILWEWYQRCRASYMPVSSPMLQEEALAITQRLGKKEFKASN